MFKNLTFRSKILLVTVPLIAVLVAAVVTSVQPLFVDAANAELSLDRALIGSSAVRLMDDLADERDLSARLLAGAAVDESDIERARAATDARRSDFIDEIAVPLAGGYAAAVSDASDRATEIDEVRALVDSGTASAAQAFDAYEKLTTPFERLMTSVGLGAADPDLVRQADALASYALGQASTASMRGYVAYHLDATDYDTNAFGQTVAFRETINERFGTFEQKADQASVAEFRSVLEDPAVAVSTGYIGELIRTGSVGAEPTVGADDWYDAMSVRVEALNGLGDDFFSRLIDRAAAVRDSTRRLAYLSLGAAVAGSFMALIAALALGRSLSERLRRVSDEAHEIATDRLPDVLSALNNPTAADAARSIPQITDDSTDEIGVLADSFNGVLKAAVETSIEHSRQAIGHAHQHPREPRSTQPGPLGSTARTARCDGGPAGGPRGSRRPLPDRPRDDHDATERREPARPGSRHHAEIVVGARADGGHHEGRRLGGPGHVPGRCEGAIGRFLPGSGPNGRRPLPHPGRTDRQRGQLLAPDGAGHRERRAVHGGLPHLDLRFRLRHTSRGAVRRQRTTCQPARGRRDRGRSSGFPGDRSTRSPNRGRGRAAPEPRWRHRSARGAACVPARTVVAARGDARRGGPKSRSRRRRLLPLSSPRPTPISIPAAPEIIVESPPPIVPGAIARGFNPTSLSPPPPPPPPALAAPASSPELSAAVARVAEELPPPPPESVVPVAEELPPPPPESVVPVAEELPPPPPESVVPVAEELPPPPPPPPPPVAEELPPPPPPPAETVSPAPDEPVFRHPDGTPVAETPPPPPPPPAETMSPAPDEPVFRHPDGTPVAETPPPPPPPSAPANEPTAIFGVHPSPPTAPAPPQAPAGDPQVVEPPAPTFTTKEEMTAAGLLRRKRGTDHSQPDVAAQVESGIFRRLPTGGEQPSAVAPGDDAEARREAMTRLNAGVERGRSIFDRRDQQAPPPPAAVDDQATDHGAAR